MKSDISVKHGKTETTISINIKLKKEGVGRVLVGMTEGETITADDLVPIHNKFGIGVVLAYLRSYLFYGYPGSFIVKVKKKKKLKKKSKK